LYHDRWYLLNIVLLLIATVILGLTIAFNAWWWTLVVFVLWVPGLPGLHRDYSDVSPTRITYCSPIGTYAIRWDAIRQVHIDEHGFYLLLIGDDQRMFLPGRFAWNRQQSVQFQTLIDQQIQMRNIVLIDLPTDFRFFYNTKIADMWGRPVPSPYLATGITTKLPTHNDDS
jgi:hypothetical protein